MCGLAGAVWRRAANQDWSAVGRNMAARIHHRGPDSQGVWHDADAGVLLAHVRLSIVDLSPAGHQPMASDCQRYTLVFNGEIYNHAELRAQLSLPPAFRGHSDTETLLACFASLHGKQNSKTIHTIPVNPRDSPVICSPLKNERDKGQILNLELFHFPNNFTHR